MNLDTEYILSVTPSGTLEFAALGNEASVLAVETDASAWEYELSDDWITASRSGNSLSVNVKDNSGTKERYGRVTVKACGGGCGVVIVFRRQISGGIQLPSPSSLTPSSNGLQG